MSIPVSVVINCAGMGRRLGLSRTKALMSICGRPTIIWQLDALRWVKDVRVVVGYQADDLIECVKSIRNDVIFAFNHDYATTGTAASFVAGALASEKLVVSLDGDLIVRPRELRSFIELYRAALGVLPVNTDEPLRAFLDDRGEMVTSFERASQSTLPAVEWSGLCQLSIDQIASSEKNGSARGNMYELIAPHLPLMAVPIDAREIDSPADFERADQWLKMHLQEWHTL